MLNNSFKFNNKNRGEVKIKKKSRMIIQIFSLLLLFVFIGFPVLSLSCNFTYDIEGNLLILHPVITGETDYKWEISNQSQVTGETDWIPTEDKKDHVFIPFIKETLWVRLLARNTTSNLNVSRVQKIDMIKSTPADLERYEEETNNDIEESSESYSKTDNFFEKLNLDPKIWVIIGIVLLGFLIFIFIKYPRDVWFYPVLRKEKE